MYSQQLSYINMSPKELYDKLLNELRPEMIALCVHDQEMELNNSSSAKLNTMKNSIRPKVKVLIPI